MTIKEVSTKFLLPEATLRYYEKMGLIGPVKRINGRRDYSDLDLQRISFVKCMRDAQVPIEVLAKYMYLFDQGDKTYDERKELLEEQRDILKNKIKLMEESLEKLEYKIKLYENNELDKYMEKL